MQIEFKAIDSLIDYEKNARTHSVEQIDQIASSISSYGFNAPIEIDSENVIISGHARVAAARKLGMKEVPTILHSHLDSVKKRGYILAANKIALNSGWEKSVLSDELFDLREEGLDLLTTGFNQDELDDLLIEDILVEGLVDEDDCPEPPPEPITKNGDIWLLGGHRLMCGDSTLLEDVSTLMGGVLADMVFTDPPYNVDYEGYTEDKLKIKQDNMSNDEFIQFLNDVFVNYYIHMKQNASIYVCHGSVYQREFQDAMELASLEVRCQIIWAKNHHAWGFGRYKFQHEPIFYGHKKGESDSWYGDLTQSTLWEVNKPNANKLHPTMKPVELVEMALINSSKTHDVVLDLFGGSGSTLIACEKIGRKCFTMELDPIYCDVIVKRYETFTGKKAKRGN